jgi:hypothetical protein
MEAKFIDIKSGNDVMKMKYSQANLESFNSQKKRDITVAIDEEPEESCDQSLNF